MYRTNGLHDTKMRYRNPHATEDLVWGVNLVPTVPDEDCLDNVRRNSLLDIKWVQTLPAHDGIALIVGKGPSLKSTWEEVKTGQKIGGAIFACNSAAWFLGERGVRSEYQVFLDPHPCTLDELYEECDLHLLASICDPVLFTRAPRPILWHPRRPGIEDCIPAARGKFVGIGGGITVLSSTMLLAYELGFRRFVVFGADSSFEKGDHYATEERIPDGERLRITVPHNGVDYETTFDLKQQTIAFMLLAKQLKSAGCLIAVRGSGLLPDAYNQEFA